MQRMEEPIGPEVSIHNLKVGEKYYGFSTNRYSRSKDHFRAVFTGYWRNSANYDMVHFHSGYYTSATYSNVYGPFKDYVHGLYWRLFEIGSQTHTYYRTSRFTEAEKKELKERATLRERRQYERGLTGSTTNDLWLPRDLVRQISLKYLTDWKIACRGHWR